MTLFTLNSDNKTMFIETLEKILCDKFKTDIEGLPENYGYSKDWSLLSLIKCDQLDTYQLMYIDHKIWSGSGGIVRNIDGEKMYQGLFRGFSVNDTRHKGLISSSNTLKNMIPYQLAQAKKNKCNKLVLSYNHYNYRLFLLHKYFAEKEFSTQSIIAYNEPKLFNGVEQWIIEFPL